MHIGACVVNKDANAHLHEVLGCLLKSDVSHVVIVDNDSEDIPQSSHLSNPIVELVRNARNVGYGSACNAGVRLLDDCEYIVVCNPDISFDPSAIDLMASCLDRNPNVGIVGPELLTASGRRYSNGRRFLKSYFILLHLLLGRVWVGNPGTRNYHMAEADRTIEWNPEWISGAFFLVRRTCWDKVAGFDEAYFMYMEDVDLCWRIRESGWQVMIQPAARVTHIGDVSTSQRRVHMAIAHTRSSWTWWCKRHHGVWQPIFALALPLIAGLRIGGAAYDAMMERLKHWRSQ